MLGFSMFDNSILQTPPVIPFWRPPNDIKVKQKRQPVSPSLGLKIQPLVRKPIELKGESVKLLLAVYILTPGKNRLPSLRHVESPWKIGACSASTKRTLTSGNAWPLKGWRLYTLEYGCYNTQPIIGEICQIFSRKLRLFTFVHGF